MGPAVATIDLAALAANYAEAARLAEGRRVIAVVKADAYGHGALPVVRTLIAAGCPELAVWSVGEAVALRDAGVALPLLVLSGALDASEAAEAAARDLSCVLHDAEGLVRLAEAARRRGGGPVRAHLEVDSGMRRMGVAAETAIALLTRIAAEPGVLLEGVMTHYARADEADLEPTREQLREFARVLTAARAQGVDPGRVHLANSAGLVAARELEPEAPEHHAVRPGLMLYGAQPSSARRADLAPVMTLEAPVVAVRRARRGDAVGYGACYRAERDTRIATVALGYADGIPIAASNRGAAWLAGRRVPIAGRVSMDSVTLEIGELPVEIGDRALLFGSEGPGGAVPLSVDEAAAAAGTIPYELLVRVGARVRRSYVRAAGGAQDPPESSSV